MTPEQQELFACAPAESVPHMVRKKPLPACGRCGHSRDSHKYAGEEDWGPPRPPEWNEPWPLPSYYKTLRCYECGNDGKRCDCPRYQAHLFREFENPFLAGNATNRKPTSLTMCGDPDCRHAKRDHHRTGCIGMSPWDGQTAPCNCSKFVNPFTKPQETEPELFPPAKEESL